MIIEEELNIGSKKFIKKYSDNKKFIKQTKTGLLYEEAVDRAELHLDYEETDLDLNDTETASAINLEILNS